MFHLFADKSTADSWHARGSGIQCRHVLRTSR